MLKEGEGKEIMLEKFYRKVNEWVESEENENERVVYIEGIDVLKRMN